MPKSINEIANRKHRLKLTKRSVESLPVSAAAGLWYDDRLAGFGVRVMPTGRRFYFIRYRNKHGRSRWFTIGEHGKVTAEAARTMAQRVLQTVAVDGTDPSGEREAFRAAPTVKDLLDRYVTEHVERRNRASTAAAFKRVVAVDIRPELGHLKVAAVTRQDLHRFHAARAGTPRQANLILAVCSKAFGLAELWEMRPEGSNPCSKIERYPENHRERFLSADELGRLGATLRRAETVGLPWKNGGRTLYRRVDHGSDRTSVVHRLSPLRSLNLRWEQVDFAEGTDRATRNKVRTPAGRHDECARAPGVEGTGDRPRASEWVLPSVVERQAADLESRDRSDVAPYPEGAAQLEDVRLHDLRHTVGTYAGQSGANAFLVRDLLRHKNSGDDRSLCEPLRQSSADVERPGG